MSKRPLALRLYAFAAAISITVMAALLVLPRFVGSPRYLEPQAALVQNMVDRFSQRDPQQLAERMERIGKRLKGKLTLFDKSGNVVRSTVDPPLRGASTAELDTLAKEKWALDWGRIVVRSDDGSMIGVYSPNRPGFPWSFVLPLGAGVLFVVALATLWFSRRLVRPLDALATTARQFGEGNIAVRAKLGREDELVTLRRAFDAVVQPWRL